MSANGDNMYHGGNYNSRQKLLFGVTIFGLVITTLVVSLRLVARKFLRVKLWWDDYLAVIALIVQFGPLISVIVGTKAGLGRHATELSSDQARIIGLSAFVHQLTHVASFSMINLQILILYIRIFPVRGLHRVCWGVGIFAVAWGLVNEIVLLLQCLPIPFFWNPTIKGHCIQQNDFYAVATVIATVEILTVFFIPIPIIWKLKISPSRRWSLAIAFTVGILASTAAVVRLVLYFTLTHEDQPWTIAPAIFWGCLEISCQIISANVPSLMPLFVALFNKERRMSQRYRDKKYQASKYRVNQYHDEKNSDPKPSTPRNRDLLSLGNAEPLPESMGMSMPGAVENDDHYDMRLIDANKKSAEKIVVTDKIEQVSEPATENDVSRQHSTEGLSPGR